MRIINTPIKDCLVIESEVFRDQRGFFQETFHREKYHFLSKEINFVQDNLSMSKKNVLRGIHFQKKYPQGKLVRVVKGSVLDIAIDLRPHSESLGKYFSINLSDNNNYQLWIPEGFGHAFLSLEEGTILEYKCTDFYKPEDEECIIWNDKTLNIDWSISNEPNISEKDLKGITFKNYLNYINGQK